MASTVIHINGFATVPMFSTLEGKTSSASMLELNEILDPPKNIAGKQCIVTASFCNFETTKPLTAEADLKHHVYFGWNVNSVWSQIYSSPNLPMLQPALGTVDMASRRYYDLGPRIVKIPDGPFSVRFFCRQLDLRNPITAELTNADYHIITAVLNFTPVE